MKKLLIIILLIFPVWNQVFSQVFNNGNGHQQIKLKFLHAKIEAAANKSIFNILSIKNNSDRQFAGTVKLSEPAGWQIIGETDIAVNVPANDSLNIPVRVIVSNKVVGEVAYAIIANLFDLQERSVLSEYCFINIPRIASLKVTAPQQIIYFDNKTETAKFQYTISNKGNTAENIQISIQGDENLSVEEQLLNESFVYEYRIPAHTDTIVDIGVKLDRRSPNKDFYKADISTYTQDSLYKNRLWFFKVDDSYFHQIPESYKCAIIELTASDVLSTNEPKYSLLAKGSILFKRNTDFYYFFRKNDLSSRWDDFQDSRFFIGVKNNYAELKVGTIESAFNEFAHGLGAKGILKPSKKVHINGFYSYNDIFLRTLYGGNLSFNFKKSSNFDIGYAENSIESIQNYSRILYSGVSFSLLKRNKFSIKTYLNNTTHRMYTPFERNGMAILSSYSGNYNKLRININAEYGSPEYTGISRGKFIGNLNLNYRINNINSLDFLYLKSDWINAVYIDDVLQPEKKSFYDSYQFIYNRVLDKNFSLYIGPLVKFESFNSVYVTLYPDLYFATFSPRAVISLKYSKSSSELYIRPTFDFGNVMVTEALDLENSEFTTYSTYKISMNSYYKDFNFYLIYQNGPSGIYNQYYYYNLNYFSKWLFVMPSYNRNFYNNRMNLDLRGTYRIDVTNQNKDLSLSSQLMIFLRNSWTLRFLNSLSSRSKVDAVNNTTLRYNSTYFEASIRKEFNCKQPRFQYYDLKVVFFKDLNGNRIKEPNEPGLQNVLASIEQDVTLEDPSVKKDFVSTKLLTGPGGDITYSNITNGFYNLKYVLIGEMVGNFNREEMNHPFTLDKDKVIYIPYLENNRIIGKVILNRDPLSSLGNIDISNIRVIAEDTRGNSYSALTDKQGNFVLYTPVTDHYVVKINNIFYESFDLQQPEFIVKFNGYKQFEVTFVFNEKKRKINFDTDVTTEDEFVMDDLKAIRKTTLSGKIRDAISLEPVDATIEIINNKTNNVISNAISNKLNGNYSISYVANENYRIEVKAKGYWDHVENLYIEQVISIQNIAKDIMLNKTSDGPKKQTFIIYDEKEEEKFTENFKSGQKIPMNNLNFDEKETRLSPNLYPELDRLIDILEKNKTVRVQVAGHADDTGKDRIDNLLALRRAKAVARYLTSHGLDESRIEVKSYSNKRPLVPGNSEKAKQKNRRVEIIVL